MVIVIGDWRGIALRGAAGLLFGLAALVWSGITLAVLVALFGAYALIDGLSVLVGAFRGARDDAGKRWPLFLIGAAGIVAGVLTFLWPDITALALLYLIAGWAIVRGAMEIAAAIELRKAIDNEWLLGLAGALSIVFGVLLAITPGAGALVITWMIGWYAVIVGVLLLALAWRLRKLQVTVEERLQHRSHRPAAA
jgi:uncharacterized membrane protein HdeD (DUF308 family)